MGELREVEGEQHESAAAREGKDMLAPAHTWRERWLRSLVGAAAAQCFPSAWRRMVPERGSGHVVQYGHAAFFGWVTLGVPASSRALHWRWRWFEPRWETTQAMPDLQEVRRDEAHATATYGTRPALVHLGSPPSAAAGTPPAAAVPHSVLPPPTADMARFHASTGPEWVFRVLERYVQTKVRLRRTAATRELWSKQGAPGGAVESFPLGWHIVDVLLPANGEDLLLSYGRPMPQGLLTLRVRIDGRLLAVEWRNLDMVPENLLDTPETRRQLEAFVHRLASEHGLSTTLPQPAGAREPKPLQSEPRQHEAQVRTGDQQARPPETLAKKAPENSSTRTTRGQRKPKAGRPGPSGSGQTESGFRIDKDLDFNRRTQGDNWY